MLAPLTTLLLLLLVCLVNLPYPPRQKVKKKTSDPTDQFPVSPFASSNRAMPNANPAHMFVSFRSRRCYDKKRKEKRVERDDPNM